MSIYGICIEAFQSMKYPHIECVSRCWLVENSLHFLRSFFSTSFKMKIPRYTNSHYINVHFLRFMSNFSCSKSCNATLTCSICLNLILVKISMSSKYTTTNLPKNGFKTSFINLMNVFSELVNMNDITNHSNSPCLILNAVFHSSPSLI